MSSGFKRFRVNRGTQRLLPFYRAYPFRSRVSLCSADDRGCVDFARGFFCNRIPKAANSSVVTELARLSTGERMPSKPAKSLFRTPATLKRHELEYFEELFKFAMVRNPYTRTLSAYLDKVERKARMRRRKSSFSAFVDRLERGGLYRNAHWAPQSALLLLPAERFDFFGRVERFEQDWRYILRFLHGAAPDGPPSGEYGNATQATENLAAYYTPELAARVARLYRADFETFGYDERFPVAL